MNTKFLNHFFNYCIYSLTILLAFLLVFEQFLELPLLVNWLGHWHPLILHFPIVLIFVTVIQYWRKDQHAASYLAVTTIFTLVSAITGFVLSLEGGSKGGIITAHQWLAVAVCFFLVLWYYFQHSINQLQIKILQGSLLVFIVVTGHFGGMVTHGKDFLAFSTGAEKVVLSLPENPNIYTHIVQPILDRKCVTCHNENKAKGELILTNHSAMMKGGKSGSILDESGGLLHRISLPIQDEEHMPPADEEQLDEDEMAVLEEWLQHGAATDLMYNDLAQASASRRVVEQLIKESTTNLWKDLPEVSDAKIMDVSSEYCTVKRMYVGSNALQVIIFPHQEFDSKELQKLKPIAENTVELNLSNLPLNDQDIKFLNSFENLEHLNLSGSTISDENFQLLDKPQKLRTLKIYNTSLGDEAVGSSPVIPALSALYVYNTKISSEGISKLAASSSSLNIVIDAPEALEFKSVLPPPVSRPQKYFFRDPFYLKFDHPLENIDIRYTLDGSEPDNNSPVLQDSLFVDQHISLKYFAGKEGWESSLMDSIKILKSTEAPFKYELTYAADEKYSGSGKSLLFDLEKGPLNFGDDAWMAFIEEPFSLVCEFKKDRSIERVQLSSIVQTDPHIFPPAAIKVYGGPRKTQLSLLGTLYPKVPEERKERHFSYYQVELDKKTVRFLKIEVTPLRALPNWHGAKGEKGWFFIDEVVLTEN